MQSLQSINGRLNVLFVIIVTLVLATLGVYNGNATKTWLERGLQSQTRSLDARLQMSLPAAIWNFDKTQIGQILQAEMSDTADNGILLVNGVNFIDGRARDAKGGVVPATKDARVNAYTLNLDSRHDALLPRPQ